MPKVKKVTALKDHPKFGIEKGEEHYVWAIKLQRGGVSRRSKTYPRQSQLTVSVYKVAAFEMIERLADAVTPESSLDDLREAKENAQQEAQEIMDELLNSLDSIPENLQSGPTADLINERFSEVEGFLGQMEGVDLDEGWEGSHETEDEWLEAKREEIRDIDLDVY